MAASGRPGREIPKDYREVVVYQIERYGWRYDNARARGGHPMLYPADRSQPPLSVPTTPSNRNLYRRFVTDVRRRGGTWPPEGRQ